MNRLLLALAILSVLLVAPKTQAQECVPLKKIALFPRAYVGKTICIENVRFFGVYTLVNDDIRVINPEYLANYARMEAGPFDWLLIPITAYERISQIQKRAIIVIHGRVIRVTEKYYVNPYGYLFDGKPQPVIEVNRIDYGPDRLYLDLKIKGGK